MSRVVPWSYPKTGFLSTSAWPLFLLRLVGSEGKVCQFQITIIRSTCRSLNKDFGGTALMFPQSFVIDPQTEVVVGARFIDGALGVRLALLDNFLRQWAQGK